jgi:hypothetical protein
MGLQACVLTAMAVVAGWMPATAVAEGFGGPCTFIGPGAILPLPVYFNATTGSPYTPHMAEFTDSESLSPSNFSATANWGDGTTTPAEISHEECYQVTAPAHAYAHSGAYSFSYTVHDAHTGLEHTIGAETIYIWGVPQHVDTPSSNVIDATGGVPWNGILGEFTEEQIPFGGAEYYAHIEWEEGDRTWAPGTITAGEDGRLVVTAAHTFPAEFSGNTTVHVGISEAETSWPVSVRAVQAPIATPKPATPQYELLGTPTLATIERPHGGKVYELIFRLSRRLPITGSEHIATSLIAFGHSSSLVSFGPDRSRACYAARLSPTTKHPPKAGAPYRFSLSIPMPAAAHTSASGKAIAHVYLNRAALRAGADKQLGC